MCHNIFLQQAPFDFLLPTGAAYSLPLASVFTRIFDYKIRNFRLCARVVNGDKIGGLRLLFFLQCSIYFYLYLTTLYLVLL